MLDADSDRFSKFMKNWACAHWQIKRGMQYDMDEAWHAGDGGHSALC